MLLLAADLLLHHEEGLDPLTVETLDTSVHVECKGHEDVDADDHAEVPERNKVIAVPSVAVADQDIHLDLDVPVVDDHEGEEGHEAAEEVVEVVQVVG